ncbi:MAG: hypothetical protein ABW185_28595 [Sedimenticola sp.]
METHERGTEAKLKFVEDRITGKINLWEKMTRFKFLTWNDLMKKSTMKENKVYHANTITSLLSRMLVVAKSDRNLDFKNTVCNYEFQQISPMLMKDDGSLPCHNKSELSHELESLVEPQSESQRTNYTITRINI